MRTSIILSVAILALVFGLYILTGLSCGDSKTPETTKDVPEKQKKSEAP